MSNKEEYAVGETVHLGLITLVCERATNFCVGCFLRHENLGCCDYIGNCIEEDRTDGKGVIFKLKEE